MAAEHYYSKSKNEKALHLKGEMLFAELRSTNEKDLLIEKVKMLFAILRMANEKASLSRGFFRGIDEA